MSVEVIAFKAFVTLAAFWLILLFILLMIIREFARLATKDWEREKPTLLGILSLNVLGMLFYFLALAKYSLPFMNYPATIVVFTFILVSGAIVTIARARSVKVVVLSFFSILPFVIGAWALL